MSDREALAIYGLKKLTAHYALKLHEGIDAGWSADALHIDVENFAANLGYEVTFERLMEEGRGPRCHDCDIDTMPCDDDGYPLEGTWELYMVKNEVWEAATGGDGLKYLCIGCLENRLGRTLHRGDFKSVDLNDPHLLDSPRLRDRFTSPGSSGDPASPSNESPSPGCTRGAPASADRTGAESRDRHGPDPKSAG